MPQKLEWKGRWALVSGGSRGLGLAISEQLATCGAKLAIVARDQEQLRIVREDLIRLGAPQVQTFALDLAEPLQFNDAETNRLQTFCNDEDILLCVAAVGKSERGLLSDLNVADIQSAININVISAFQISQLALSSLKRSKGSYIAIASIAGLTTAKGLGAYSLSKSALVAMTRQLRQELAEHFINVTLVCTGPIARQDAGHRYDESVESRNLTETMKQAGAGVKLRALKVDRLVAQILHAGATGKAELVLPRKVRLLAAIIAISPRWGDWIIQKSFRSG